MPEVYVEAWCIVKNGTSQYLTNPTGSQTIIAILNTDYCQFNMHLYVIGIYWY